MKTWTTRNGMQIIRVLTGRCHVFLLTNGERHMLIDSGIGMMRNMLEKRLRQLPIDRPDMLVLTHAHFDHAGNAGWVRERYHAGVIIHQNEALSLETGQSEIPGGTVRATRLLVSLLSGVSPSYAAFEPCRHDIAAGDRYDLNEYGIRGYLLHTPGHTPGSLSVIVDDEIALVGDTLFGIFPGSVFPPFAMDVPELLHSWEKLLMTGCSWFLPSHGSVRDRALLEKEYTKRMNRR